MTKKYLDFLKLNIYQIYIKSFKDSNNDGIGDINGIIEKLDYLKDLGINAIWLCPCYKSPQDDGGYDISDYRDIAPEYGTLEDLINLKNELHKRGMKLIMDLVANHTSTSHKWFQESRKGKDNPYSDYYYWFDEIPNNWKSTFGGSAYQYDKVRKQYYLHSYAISQADLNMDNPKVLKEIQDVIDYWVKLGIDGFRCDVIDQISKDFKNERNCFGPNLHKYINLYFGRKNTKHLFTVGECWANTIEEIKNHCSEERNELSTLFQFDHIRVGRNGKWIKTNPELVKYRDILIKWQNLTQENNLIYSLFTDNHDNAYLISRLGNKKYHYESATLIAAMTYLLKGVPFIYQGVEIGTTSSNEKGIKEFRDVETINYYDEKIKTDSISNVLKQINFGSRDNARRPFSWDDSKYAGFSNCTPWIKPSTDYKKYNLKNEMINEKSIYNFYKNILSLRNKIDAFTLGDFKDLSIIENAFIFKRSYKNNSYIVICNFDKENKIKLYKNSEIVLSNYNRKTIPEKLKPYEVLVLKFIYKN